MDSKIAWFIFGGVVGGVAGYFAGELIVDQIRKKEEADYCESYATLSDESPFDEEAAPTTEEIEEKPVKADEGAKLNGKAKNHKTVKIDYTQFAKKNGTIENPDLIELASRYATPVADTPLPHVITVDEYSQTHDDYEKVALTYYSVDEVLVTDSDEQPVDNADDILGHAGLVSFGEGSEDDDIVYIRNDSLSTDYEVTRVYKSYGETVGGFVESEQTRKAKPRDDDDDEEEITPRVSPRTRRTKKVKKLDEDGDEPNDEE